jgi:hypothetical protein
VQNAYKENTKTVTFVNLPVNFVKKPSKAIVVTGEGMCQRSQWASFMLLATVQAVGWCQTS